VALTDEAMDKIKAMIVAGDLAPGSRLPKEEILAGQLALSRSSLREAVRTPTAIRILVTRQGDGNTLRDGTRTEFPAHRPGVPLDPLSRLDLSVTGMCGCCTRPSCGACV
jgi:DNA-binding FadR family transcriptional regulator